MKAAFAFLVSVVLVGCGARQHGGASTAPSFPRGLYALRVTTVTIDPLRENGQPWHVTEPDQTPVVVGALVGLAAGNPEVGMALGSAIADKGGDPLPPRPAIRVRVTGGEWQTLVAAEPTYTPTYEQWIAIDARAMTGDEAVLIQIIDATDGGLIALGSTTVADLVAQPVQTLAELHGRASHLELETRAMPEGDGLDEATVRAMSEGL